MDAELEAAIDRLREARAARRARAALDRDTIPDTPSTMRPVSRSAWGRAPRWAKVLGALLAGGGGAAATIKALVDALSAP